MLICNIWSYAVWPDKYNNSELGPVVDSDCCQLQAPYLWIYTEINVKTSARNWNKPWTQNRISSVFDSTYLTHSFFCLFYCVTEEVHFHF